MGGGGSPAGSNPGGTGLCMSTTVQSGRVAPDILIVLDRSLSMKMDNVNRWDPSVAGLKTITSMLQDRVAFGLMVFPGPMAVAGDQSSVATNNPQACDTGTQRVQTGHKNAKAIAQALDQIQPGGRTPTAPTLAAAHQLINTNRQVDPDSLAAPQYVLLVTDGAPNCSTGIGGGILGGGFGSGEPAAVDQSVSEITGMAKDGIRTYVLGYDTQNDPQLKSALDRMAAAGGTGDTAHRAIEDENSLIDQFQQITSVALSCEFTLDEAVNNPRRVLVKLDGKQLNLDDSNGFRLSDSRTVTLQGKACETVKKDGHTLNVSVECEDVGTVF